MDIIEGARSIRPQNFTPIMIQAHPSPTLLLVTCTGSFVLLSILSLPLVGFIPALRLAATIVLLWVAPGLLLTEIFELQTFPFLMRLLLGAVVSFAIEIVLFFILHRIGLQLSASVIVIVMGLFLVVLVAVYWWKFRRETHA